MGIQGVQRGGGEHGEKSVSRGTIVLRSPLFPERAISNAILHARNRVDSVKSEIIEEDGEARSEIDLIDHALCEWKWSVYFR